MIMSRGKRLACGIVAAFMLAAPTLAADPTQAMLSTAAALTEEYDLPDGLILAVAETESDFDPSCVTGKCKGLMQIHSSYAGSFASAAGMEDYDLLDYKDSMRIAAYLLSDYMTRYEGDLHFALMAYNLGEYGAKAKRRDGVQTTSYSRKVAGLIDKWGFVELVEAPVVEETPVKEAALPDSANPDALTPSITAFVTGIHQLVREVLFR